MAKEGFSGLLETPKHIYPELHEEFDEQELMDLDTEGRVVMTDHQFFVLFNVSWSQTYKLGLFSK
jgi:AP endonuclease-2